MKSLQQKISFHLKNSFGWSTKRKFVAFSVDDYGNIRIANRRARHNLINAGFNLDKNRFDQFDTLETAEDLSALFAVLNSVKDKNGSPAIFTAYALPANIDFERIEQADYKEYYYELLPNTLRKLPEHAGTWELWQEGISKGFFIPQYHGREHVNIKLLVEMLRSKNSSLLSCFKERSWAGLDLESNIDFDYVSAFSFRSFEEISDLQKIAIDGLIEFEKVFGFKATNFTSPGSSTHIELEMALKQYGIAYIETPFIKHEPIGNGKYRSRLNYMGKMNKKGQFYLLRNCVFEPLLNQKTSIVTRTLWEIENAFKHNKPAIVSSHRVNFCGMIDSNIREYGLSELSLLLRQITRRWPDVEFISTAELGNIISAEKVYV